MFRKLHEKFHSVTAPLLSSVFENGKYSYKIVLGSDDLRSWFEAEEICREREGGHLASITSKAENTFVNEKILLLGHLPDEVQELWLGAIDERLISVDAYHWVDGENFRYVQLFMVGTSRFCFCKRERRSMVI